MMPKTQKMTLNQKVILFLMSIIALCLCALALALAPNVTLIPETSPALPPAAEIDKTPTAPVVPTPLQHKKFMAQIKCERFVKKHLVSPASAKFSYEKTYRVNGEPMNYHAVTGIVESQNRMGVWLQSEYRCDLHYSPNNPGVWVLDYLDIED